MAPARAEARRKPDGGVRFLGVEEIARVWCAYQARRIQLRDVRIYLALHELVARRCQMGRGRKPWFTLEELQGLVGGAGGRRLRECLSRLDRLGLARFRPRTIRLADEIGSRRALVRAPRPSRHRGERASEPHRVGEMLAAMPAGLRRIPFPRRMLRHLAGSGSRAEIATALGLGLRALRYRKGLVRAAGACSARWVAETFGMDEVRVRLARRTLARLGWLEPLEVSWSLRQRFGQRYRIRLAWSPPAGGLPPLQRPSAVGLQGPRDTLEPDCRRSVNVKPAARTWRGRGVRGGARSDPLGPFRPQDLADPRVLLALHRTAVERGWCRPGEAGELELFALAEHARIHGRRPGALLAWLLRHRRPTGISLAEENTARRRLRAHAEPRPDGGNGRRVPLATVLRDLRRALRPPESETAARSSPAGGLSP